VEGTAIGGALAGGVKKSMKLGDEEIARIALWESVCPGFDRNNSTIEKYVQPILNQLRNCKGIEIYGFENGGLSNYFAFMACETHSSIRKAQDSTHCGIVVYLSLMAPVAVIGRSDIQIGDTWRSLPHFKISDAVDSAASCEDRLLKLVRSVLSKSEYRLLSLDEINQPLPNNVTPFEYCMCDELWNRYFHALFANTD